MTTSLIRQWNSSAEGPEEDWINNVSLVKGSEGTVEVYLVPAFDPQSLNAKTALSDHHLLIGKYSLSYLF